MKNDTGYYGEATQRAVEQFQANNGLTQDGEVGLKTAEALLDSNAKKASSSSDSQEETKTESTSSSTTVTKVGLGDSGSIVRKVQKQLVKLGYMKNDTGYYGEATARAVEQFQANNGLTQDGEVGIKTAKALLDDDAKGASSSEKEASEITSSSSAFDCSGFVYWALNKAGVSQGYMTSSGWGSCTKYEREYDFNSLKRGDVVVFSGHVGIYLGGGSMIDASSSEGKIRICNNIQSNSYWKSHFKFGARVF